MRQDWLDLTYIHWRFSPADVQRLLPSGLTVDTFDGSAWVGLIPFSMRRIGLPVGPAIPYFGSFAEVNVRTYVHVNGKPGVWFFSLDVDRLAPAVVARVTYRLPYCWGKTSHVRLADRTETVIRRTWPNTVDDSTIIVQAGGHRKANDLDNFLSARWGLYSSSRKGLRYAAVDHEPWPLRDATLVRLDDSLLEAAGLPKPVGEPHVMFSDGVHVRIGMPHRV